MCFPDSLADVEFETFHLPHQAIEFHDGSYIARQKENKKEGASFSLRYLFTIVVRRTVIQRGNPGN